MIVRVDGQEVEVAADRVVVAAGAYGSPAVLLRSGVGPAEELAAASIEARADLPGVGRNLVDPAGLDVWLRPRASLLAATAAHYAADPARAQSVIKAQSQRCAVDRWDLHLSVLVDGVRLARRLAGTKALTGLCDGELAPVRTSKTASSRPMPAGGRGALAPGRYLQDVGAGWLKGRAGGVWAENAPPGAATVRTGSWARTATIWVPLGGGRESGLVAWLGQRLWWVVPDRWQCPVTGWFRLPRGGRDVTIDGRPRTWGPC